MHADLKTSPQIHSSCPDTQTVDMFARQLAVVLVAVVEDAEYGLTERLTQTEQHKQGKTYVYSESFM